MTWNNNMGTREREKRERECVCVEKRERRGDKQKISADQNNTWKKRKNKIFQFVQER